jgi:hypothetical protein
VTAQLVPSPGQSEETLDRIQSVSLRLVDDKGDAEDDPLMIARGDSTHQVRGGAVEFTGRFLGKYALNVRLDTQDQSQVVIPMTVELDNLEGNQDLGELPLPRLGRVRFELTFDPPPTGPTSQYMQLGGVLRPHGEAQSRSTFMLRPDQPSQTFDTVALGEYDAMIYSMVYEAEPLQMPVTITAGETAVVAATLRPIGIVFGNVDHRSVPSDFQFRSVTLRGPLSADEPKTRIVVPQEGVDDDELFLSREDFTYRTMFLFRNLAGGGYQLTLEASGYEPYATTWSVVPGQMAQGFEKPIELTPLP